MKEVGTGMATMKNRIGTMMATMKVTPNDVG